jgi:uncharacterized cupin superfamily protein
MPHLLPLTPTNTEPETSTPAPERLIHGDPVHTTWVLEDREGLCAGLWQSTPGKWRVFYDEWEYCRILEGHSVVTGEDGTTVHLRPGDALILRPGFRGTWEVLETTRKDFVIRY